MNKQVLWAIVVILIVLALIGVPDLGFYHHGYGYGPSGLVVVVVVVLLILLLS